MRLLCSRPQEAQGWRPSNSCHCGIHFFVLNLFYSKYLSTIIVQSYFLSVRCVVFVSCDTMLARYILWPCVYLFATSWSSVQMANYRIMQTMPHTNPWTPFFWCQRSWGDYNGVTPNWVAKCRWVWLKSAVLTMTSSDP